MSVSTDGILYFGFDFYDPEEGKGEEGQWMRDYCDWEEYLAKKMGVEPPAVLFHEDEDGHRAFWKRVRELAEEAGCVVSSHCSVDSPIYFVTLADKHFVAPRGCPLAVNPEVLNVTDGEVQKLKTFCGLMDITWQEPKWYLASDWG